MIEWAQLLGTTAVSLALLALLALPIVFALRLRGFAAVVVGLPAALAVVALAAILAPILGISWSVWPPIVLALLLAALLFLVRRYLHEHVATLSRPHRAWWPLLGAAIGFVFITWTIIRVLPAPDAISQTYDAVFHLGAVRYILDTGSASPFDMNLTAPDSGGIFYPTLWHSLVALTVQLSGASIPAATNAVLLLVIAVIWPLGAVALGRAVAGPSRRATLIAGASSAAFLTMPLALAGFGVLYPNLLSTAIAPYFLVPILQLFRVACSRDSLPLSPLTRWLLLFGALGAAMLAHPNALHVALAFLSPLALFAALRAFRAANTGWGKFRPVAALLGLLLVGGAVWYFGRSGLNPWIGQHSALGALVEGIGSTPRIGDHNWVLALFALTGLLIAARYRRIRPMVGVYLVFLGLYVLADGFAGSRIRDAFLTPWYSDPWRLAAILPLAALPLAVLGGSTLAAIAGSRLRRYLSALPRVSRATASRWTAAILVLVFGAALLGTGQTAADSFLRATYNAGSDAPLLSADERLLLERLPSEVEEDAVLIANPWNGSSLAYAISGRQVIPPHAAGSYDLGIYDVANGISEGDPAACASASRLGITYVLDFGREFVFDGGWADLYKPFLSISAIEDHQALTEIDREGDAVLYRITGCENHQ